MADGSVTCLTTVLVVISSLIAYLTTRRLETQKRNEQQKQVRDAQNRRWAILEMRKWVYSIHEAVYFAEVLAHRAVSRGKMDTSEWREIAEKIDETGPRPPRHHFLPEALHNTASPMETKLGELKALIARHKESLGLIAYGRPGLPAPSEADLEAAQYALAQDLEDRARQFNVWVVALEKQLDEAFWETLP